MSRVLRLQSRTANTNVELLAADSTFSAGLCSTLSTGGCKPPDADTQSF